MDPKTCEELCFTYHDLHCEYWVYSVSNRTCVLLQSAGKICENWGGPQYPPYRECTSTEPSQLQLYHLINYIIQLLLKLKNRIRF